MRLILREITRKIEENLCSVCNEKLKKRGVKLLGHPPYSPDLAPCDFSLFGKVKANPVCKSIKEETVSYMWERTICTIPTSEFRLAFNKWLERHLKCIKVGREYVKKL